MKLNCAKVVCKIVILALLLVSNPLCKGAGTLKAILEDVQCTNQITSMWCWAASGQMIMAHYGTNVAQCTQANLYFNLSDCCIGSDSECVNGGWPQFEKFGFSYDYTQDTNLQFSEIQAQINNKCPVAFSWHWLDSEGHDDGGHMMVVYGWEVSDGIQYVWVHDPHSDNEGLMTYEEYVSGNDHRHWNDFFNITKVR